MQTALLILASGSGTRNQMLTYGDAMPKCLLSVGDKTCVEAIIDSYKNCKLDKIIVATQLRYAIMIDDLLKFRGYNDVDVIAYEPQPTASDSLRTALKHVKTAFGDYDLYINWSDVFMTSVPTAEQTTIFADSQYRHRNLGYIGMDNFAHVVSTSNLHGNVPGIYFVKNDAIKVFMSSDYTDDFDKWLADNANAVLAYVDDITDIGDYAKYSAFMSAKSKENVCRYFNKIDVEKDKVYKQPATEYGEKLHAIELAYYRTFDGKGTNMAKLLGYDAETKTMILERLRGQTCQAFVDAKPTKSKLSTVNRLLKKFDTAIQLTHTLPVIDWKDSQAEVDAAIIDEFYEKIDARVQPCMNMIKAVLESGVKSIEGMPICEYDKLLDAVQKWLSEHKADFKIGYTHGDPNTDNSLLCNSSIRFVDPRGYFGKLKTLGLGVQEYDYAKFAYGFSGYSKLNRAEFLSMCNDNGDLKIYVGPTEIPNITDVSIFDMNVSNDIKVMVGIIWVKLTSYIINDPMKAVAAYLYGNALLTKLLNIK